VAKLSIVDDDGTTYEFDQFIGAGLKDKTVMRFIQDEGLSGEERLLLLIEGAKLVGEMGSILVPDREGDTYGDAEDLHNHPSGLAHGHRCTNEEA